MSAPDAHDLALDSLVEDAIEVLLDRTMRHVEAPRNPQRWRDENRAALHSMHDRHAFELLTADGGAGLTAKALADLLDPVEPERPEPVEDSPASAYERAERFRRERNASMPDGWLEPGAFARCLADARAQLITQEDSQ